MSASATANPRMTPRTRPPPEPHPPTLTIAPAELVAVLFPERSQLEDLERFGTPYRLAQELFEEMEIPKIRGSLAFEGARQRSGAELEDLFLKGDNLHYTAEGHERLAMEMARALAPTVMRRAQNAPLLRDWRVQYVH